MPLLLLLLAGAIEAYVPVALLQTKAELSFRYQAVDFFLNFDSQNLCSFDMLELRMWLEEPVLVCIMSRVCDLVL